MSSITFDTHESELVTRKDLQIELAPLKADLNLLKWMLGFVLAGIATLIFRTLT